jgi:hypothetical protein
MFELLYACGDSFTHGMEILGDCNVSEENKYHAYPMQITDELGIANNINSALPGAPNEWIARTTILDLLKLQTEGQDLSKVFVIIGWSGINRLEITAKEEIKNLKKTGDWPPLGMVSTEIEMFGTNFVNPNTTKWVKDGNGDLICNFGDDAQMFCAQFLWDEDLEHEKWFGYIMAVKSFCEANNIKYFMHNNVHEWNRLLKIRPNFLVDTVFGKEYYKFDTFSFSQWAKQKHSYGKRREGHYSKQVHTEFKNLVLPYIKEHIL